MPGEGMQVKAILYIMQMLSDSPILIKITTKAFLDARKWHIPTDDIS